MQKVKDIICPVCGYYCLGKGGYGCIDKLYLFKQEGKSKNESKNNKAKPKSGK